MRRALGLLASTALCAAPVAAQKTAPTLKTSGPVLSKKSGKPAPKTWAEWWAQFLGLPDAKPAPVTPPVGDAEEPELGVALNKVPESIPSNFDVSKFIATGYPATGSSGADPTGAFRFVCMPGQVLRDDPIVFPGQPGKSHLHQFFGNLSANAFSTYRSLRNAGQSTCINPINRSAYWIPAMLDGKGNVRRPDYTTNYYKRVPANDPQCKTQGNECVPLPRGLRYIFGYDMVSGTPPTGAGHFVCEGPTAGAGEYRLLAEVAAVCPAGNRIGAVLNAPACWDGVHLDSPNHRDHVGYAMWRNKSDGSTAYACDEKHPKVIAGFTLAAWYYNDGSAANWYLSSDDMSAMGHGRLPGGTTLHGDWLGAWDDGILALFESTCFNGHLSCSGGDLGNGTGMKQDLPFSWEAQPRTIPVPAQP